MFFEWLLDRSFVELVSIIPLRNYLEDKMEDCMIYICSIKHYFDIYITLHLKIVSNLIEQYLEELKINIPNHVEIILLTSWFSYF